MAIGNHRLDVIDSLRGGAILGILLVNIMVMGSTFRIQEYPPAAGWSRLDQAFWWIQSLFIEDAMRGLLSILFGVSTTLLLDQLAVANNPSLSLAAPYYRRTLALILIGLAHGYFLLWPGDILFIYGLAGLFLYPLRDQTPKRLIEIGLMIFALSTALEGSRAFSEFQLAQRADVASQKRESGYVLSPSEQEAISLWQTLQPNPYLQEQKKIEEKTARLGSFSDNLKFYQKIFREENLGPSVLWWTANALALMLIGMGLARQGLFQSHVPPATLLALTIAGYTVGLSLNALKIWMGVSHSFASQYFLPRPVYQISQLGITLGHLGAILLAWRITCLQGLLRPLRYVGRVALSNYIAQTILMQFVVFPGFGLNLFGYFHRAQLWGVAILCWGLQLAVSYLWLQHFTMGPLEWLWRWATYQNRQVFIKPHTALD